MRRYVLRRIGLLVPVVLGVVTVVFLIVHLIPGDPVEIMLGEQARAVDREALRHEMGLDKPIHLQYVAFLKGLVRGDLGHSLHTKQPVLTSIASRLPATIELAAAAMAVALLLAIPLGLLAAYKKDSLVDQGSMLFALLGISMPNFWLGPLLIIVFSLKLGWFPVSGRGSLAHVVLPAITLGTAMAAILTRMTRASMLDVIQSDYITTARAKGVRESLVVLKHAFRNALIPVVTIVGLQIGGLLAGSIITETIFAWPGIGRLTIQAINARDYPLVQGCVLIIALGYVLVNFATDLLYGLIDPRIRYE
ncbi:MAG: nickel ABC transporter permease [bacterium]|nr:ABC transporter permease [bacterium]MDV2479953.1 ABC transporter permease [bacterium]